MSKNSKDWKFFSLMLIGFVLVLISLFIEPKGIIDNSVLFAVGQLTLLLAGLLECCIHIDIKNGYLHLGKMTESETKKHEFVLRNNTKKDYTENNSESSIIN